MLGAKEAYYVMTNKSGFVSSIEVINVVDMTETRDTFAGIYVVKYVKMKRFGIWDVITVVGKVCKAAAVIVERFGT
ncbi:hypothetical protein EYR41_007693 [Orbilia oligospora]|uniref:Uncharacterized protein n=1 Tax=Orbilia oligospora TaxID=2813651 RepID=A0A8H2HNX0_ORBOL|nr:hypothetical protein EYR41_007693 [Orbilia oligospora]